MPPTPVEENALATIRNGKVERLEATNGTRSISPIIGQELNVAPEGDGWRITGKSP